MIVNLFRSVGGANPIVGGMSPPICNLFLGVVLMEGLCLTTHASLLRILLWIYDFVDCLSPEFLLFIMCWCKFLLG